MQVPSETQSKIFCYRQSFALVEKEYNESIGHLLARKAVLLEAIPKDLSQYEVTQRYKHILDEMIAIHDELSGGCSACLALIYKSKLYVGNLGNCKALLCKNDDNNVLRVTQLSVDHDLSNPDEEERIRVNCGLDVKSLKQNPNFLTRCFGNYLGKVGFKDNTILSGAKTAPILSDPEIVGPISIDDTCRFLILMSKGLCKTLIDIFDADSSRINKEIVQMTVEQFRTQTNLINVAQVVVNKISLQHHDTFMASLEEEAKVKRRRCETREDMTLLIRNFNYPLPNAPLKRASQSRSTSDTSSSILTADGTGTNSSTTSDFLENGRFFNPMQTIKPYVDFSGYYKMVEEARKNGTLPAGINFD